MGCQSELCAAAAGGDGDVCVTWNCLVHAIWPAWCMHACVSLGVAFSAEQRSVVVCRCCSVSTLPLETHLLAYCSENLRITSRFFDSVATSASATASSTKQQKSQIMKVRLPTGNRAQAVFACLQQEFGVTVQQIETRRPGQHQCTTTGPNPAPAWTWVCPRPQSVACRCPDPTHSPLVALTTQQLARDLLLGLLVAVAAQLLREERVSMAIV